MIVRILTEGQYRLDDGILGRVNELDNACVEAVDAGDEARFREALTTLLELVRSEGQPLADDELVESQIMLPPPDTKMSEVAQEFTGEGLIPD